MGLDQRTHWLVFDDNGRRNLRIRGGVWLNRDTINSEILGNPAVVHKENTIRELATAAGLPGGQLQATIDRYNAFVATGQDADFGRFGPAAQTDSPDVQALIDPPFFAIRLLPMTRKSMGGLAIDTNAQVLGKDGRPIDGLFAAGEATGVAGINGSHGGSGTFLAPSVLTGRIAGRHAALSACGANTVSNDGDHHAPAPSSTLVDGDGGFPMLAADHVRNLLEHERPGYWHWELSHATVLERALACADCHSRDWPTVPATTVAQQLLQLETCTRCH